MAKSAPKHFFSKLASVNMPRSQFDLSHTNTTTLTTDYLYPCMCEEVLPGDSFNFGVSSFIRFIAPLNVPMMDNLYCDYHFWYVPMRLVWENTKYFFGEQSRSNTTNDYTIPQVTFSADALPETGSIYDYFELPIKGTDNLLTGAFSVNALPFRAYNLIYDEWYRDEQRCGYSYYNNGDEATPSTEYKLLKRGKRFDYFTSSLLEPQIGDPVTVPIGGYAPVYGDGTGLRLTDMSQSGWIGSSGVDATSVNPALGNLTSAVSRSAPYVQFNPSNGLSSVGFSQEASPPLNYNTTMGVPTKYQYTLQGKTWAGQGQDMSSSGITWDSGEYLTGLVADMTSVSAVDIATFRNAFQMQSYQELNARGGTRYTEYIYTQFGVISPDARLQRPEFLGGNHLRLAVQPVIQNSGTGTTGQETPQGNISAIVYGGTSEHSFTRSFTEHGYIIGIMNIYSDLTYYQGLQRKWTRQTNLDFAIPIFANLTDQTIKNKELVLTGTDSDDEVFGYAERYAEYKYSQNTLTGLVRPNAPLTIGQWSLAEQFASVPTNDENFINMNTPIQRISAVTDSPYFIVNHKFSGNVVRCLPAYSDPMKWFMRG
ncbi:MAG: hypothetical protein NC200_06805 [Candidatus Gastranaerophilales bacterium]|nr:hypothetical protein [Candidatus Gastranaerophilales bacterium]